MIKEIERTTIQNWLKNFNTDNCLGFTGDLKQHNINYGYMNDVIAIRNTKRFLNYLNYKIYKNKFKRNNKHLKLISVVEGSWKQNKRYHIHQVIEKPPTNIIGEDDFNNLLLDCWNKTYYSYSHPHIHNQIDFGWLNYITKLNHADDFIDWENTFLS